MILRLLITLTILFSTTVVVGEGADEKGTYVDENGVIRWRQNNSEVKGFGVNYSLPFAHAFRMAERMRVSHEEAIIEDVYHFARLDFDLYRVHVWDTEISDTVGNLLQNEHLRLFDFAVAEMKKRNMKLVITPIAFWGNGWPEPNFDTPGFANKYGKAACLTHPEAIKAQENYLYQFLNHVNPYTGLAYKDDHDVIAFEVSNEPHHGGAAEEVTEYINRMVASMRRAGTTIPIFYNMSHSIHLVDAYLNADVQGGTFQWYPAGLVAHRQINGNFLPHVAEYHIPFADDPGFRNTGKLVYEFDPADVGGNYMYPAMARSFRQAGMQLATHFDYDAMFLAPYNTNYGTHYMTLPYAPQKALSLKIASAIFHEIPLYSDFGGYPGNNQFGDFSISYEKDLVELVSSERFFYSNHTSSVPDSPEQLTEIAGYGNSPLVEYDGKGAYFLDKIGDGAWRLEVMPDAHWLGDPYARVSPRRQVAAVSYNRRQMAINLPQLGPDFSVQAINEGKLYQATANEGQFEIMPGVYILQKKDGVLEFSPFQSYRNILLNEYVAPEADLRDTIVKNFSPAEATAGKQMVVSFEVISPEIPEKVEVMLYGNAGNLRKEATYKGADIYELEIEEELTAHGLVNYYILLHHQDEVKTFPAGLTGQPGEWDFYDHSVYTIRFVPETEPIQLWCAANHWNETLRQWQRSISVKPFGFNNSALHKKLDQLPVAIHNGEEIRNYTFKFYFRDLLKGRISDFSKKSTMVIQAETIFSVSQPLEIGLIDINGIAYTAALELKPGTNRHELSLSMLNQGKFTIIPRSYPGFMRHFNEASGEFEFNPEEIEVVQFSVLAGANEEVDLMIEKIWLE